MPSLTSLSLVYHDSKTVHNEETALVSETSEASETKLKLLLKINNANSNCIKKVSLVYQGLTSLTKSLVIQRGNNE